MAEELYTIPARCRICGTRFLARYNVGSRAKCCTRGSHSCSPSSNTLPSGKVKTIPCKIKCCRSQYAQGKSATMMDHAIDQTKVLSDPEFKKVVALIRQLPNREKMPLLFIAATGCRLGESFLVYPEDLDFTSQIPSARIPTLKRKGRPVRTVDLTDPIFTRELKAYSKTRKNLVLFEAGRRTLQKKFKEVLANAKLKKSGAVHLLRHTRASQLIRAGCDLPEVRRLLGWASLEMLKIYAHTDIESRLEVGKRLPAL